MILDNMICEILLLKYNTKIVIFLKEIHCTILKGCVFILKGCVFFNVKSCVRNQRKGTPNLLLCNIRTIEVSADFPCEFDVCKSSYMTGSDAFSRCSYLFATDSTISSKNKIDIFPVDTYILTKNCSYFDF